MRAGALLARWWGPSPQRVAARQGYALWAPVYPPRPHNAVMESESSVVAPLLTAAAPGRVALDVGTGTGRNAAMLKSAGARQVVAVDLSLEMLERCEGRVGRVRADAVSLPFVSGSFDLISSSLMCGDIADLHTWLAEAARLLKPGGQLVYSDFHPSWSSAGWKRTFTGADGRSYELPFFTHAIEQHIGLLETYGLALRTVREPKIPSRHTPAVVVIHAAKDVDMSGVLCRAPATRMAADTR